MNLHALERAIDSVGFLLDDLCKMEPTAEAEQLILQAGRIEGALKRIYRNTGGKIIVLHTLECDGEIAGVWMGQRIQTPVNTDTIGGGQ